MSTRRLLAGGFVLSAFLVACGGGGGGGGTTPPTNSWSSVTPCPAGYTGTAPNCVAPTTTNASGTVVNDATGAALAGVSVKLMPWGPCGATPAPSTLISPQNDGCPTPLPSPQVTTDPSGNFTLGNVPNGQYLLVIGADAVATVPPGYTTPPGSCSGPCPSPTPVAGSPVQATIHDNVTLTGGIQTLKAPTLPSVPSGYTAPPWETNGSYRIATMDSSTEMPCLLEWQYQRAKANLAGTSVDEWLLENVRAGNAYAATLSGGGSIPAISTGGNTTSGGVSCASQIDSSFGAGVNRYATDPRTLWFSGQYIYATARGIAEFPIDPRSFIDANHPNWP